MRLLEENDRLRAVLRRCEPLVRVSADAVLLRDLQHALELPELDDVTDTEREVLLRIVTLSAALFKVKVGDILGTNRQHNVVRPRHVAMYVARQRTRLSFPELGRSFGRDHSTVQHACRQITAALGRCSDGRVLILPGDNEVRHAVKSINNRLTLDELSASEETPEAGRL